MFDDRVDSATLVTEKSLLIRKKRVKVLRRTKLSKRWAAEILADFGPKDCPSELVISPDLFQEARETLGWSKRNAAWMLGHESRSAAAIERIESGQTRPRRFVRILMMQALEKLAVRQRKLASSATFHGMRERE